MHLLQLESLLLHAEPNSSTYVFHVELYNVSKTPRCFGGTTATVGTVPTTANIDGV
jgi:hypothetical protein